MSTIPTYNLSAIQGFIRDAKDAYEKAVTQTLPFEEWKCLAYPNLYKNPNKFRVKLVDYSKPVRISPTGIELLKIIDEHRLELDEIKMSVPPDQQDGEMTKLFRKIFTPVKEFMVNGPLTIDGEIEENGKLQHIKVPIWFNTTLAGVNVRLGFDNLDASTPGSVPLGDKPVHMMLGGTTGSGKSVALNDIICSLLLEYAPWELSLVLADFKIVELSRYANRIPTPHVKLVAATGSTEFALSTFKYLTDEMEARQKVFTACGVQNLKDFRKKFDLVMPRILLIADEFVQMFENVKTATEKGSENADEIKSSIKNAISAVARLGRSQGVHMLLSSQNMDGVLDEQTAGQFSAGACLKATASISKTLIGNDAGATIEVRGRAYTNLDKVVPDSPNTLVRVPFIESEAKVIDGVEQKTYLLQLLEVMNTKAKELGYGNEPFYYNENDTIPRKQLYDALAECIEYMQNPDEGDQIRNALYKEETFARIPLGRELAYTTALSYPLSLQFKRNHNLLINADDNIIKISMLRIVGECLAFFASKFVIASADIAIYRQANLEEFAKRENISVVVDTTRKLPIKYMKMTQTRKQYLELQNLFDTESSGQWNDKVALSFAYSRCAQRNPPPLDSISKMLADKYSELVTAEDVRKFIETNTTNLQEDILNFYVQVCGMYVTLYKTYAKLSNNFTKKVCSRSFESIVIWWLGVDNFENITVRDNRLAVRDFFTDCSTVGIFNVIIPSLKCEGLGDICTACNFVLEKCSKQFFIDAEVTPRAININENSYQVFDRMLRTNKIVRLYS